MITFILLTLVVLLLVAVVLLVGGTALASIVVLFGDFIVFGLIVFVFVKLFKMFKKRK